MRGKVEKVNNDAIDPFDGSIHVIWKVPQFLALD